MGEGEAKREGEAREGGRERGRKKEGMQMFSWRGGCLALRCPEGKGWGNESEV